MHVDRHRDENTTKFNCVTVLINCTGHGCDFGPAMIKHSVGWILARRRVFDIYGIPNYKLFRTRFRTRGVLNSVMSSDMKAPVTSLEGR